MSAQPEPPPERRLPEHVTAPLLALITSRSLDEDYAHVARQRAVGDKPPRDPRRSRATTILTVAAVGLLMAVAAVQSQRDAEVDELGRAALIGQIESGREQLAALERRKSEVTAGIRTAEQRVATLQGQQRDLATVQRRLETGTGYVAVRGPGVRITVANPPGADATTEIRDEDLATLVDGLWTAGADAVAINGERLTVLRGIRNTGRAVHVGGDPISAPYVVEAIGDPGDLQARLLESSQGAAWFVLVRSFGFEYSAENVNDDDLVLPAADLRVLRHAEPLSVGDNADVKQEEDSAP